MENNRFVFLGADVSSPIEDLERADENARLEKEERRREKETHCNEMK